MKRNMDLVRQILLEIEKRSDPGEIAHVQLVGFDEEEISYHIQLLDDGGLLKGTDFSTRTVDWMAGPLTWEGHDYLDAIRSDTIWKKVKIHLKDHGLSYTFEIVKALAVKFGKEAAGLIDD